MVAFLTIASILSCCSCMSCAVLSLISRMVSRRVSSCLSSLSAVVLICSASGRRGVKRRLLVFPHPW